MRRPRIKADGEGFYHVVSRIGGRRFLIDDGEKGILLGMVRRAAAFSGVEVYTHALMDNHFHLLVRVPGKRRVGEAELVRRLAALCGEAGAAETRAQWEKWERKGKGWRAEEEKGRLRARMHDLSQFCKTFKEAYTQDYNRRKGNTGTIWEGRFKSMLLEGSDGALMAVAAYIHLNPVRAGMARAAEEAGNTGYGAACAGDAAARAGLAALAGRLFGESAGNWEAAREAFGNAVEGKIGAAGGEGEATTLEAVSPGGGGGTTDATSCVPPGRGGKATAGATSCVPPDGVGELLGRRHAGFLHGGALGSEGFLRKMEAAGAWKGRRRRRPPGVWDGCGGLGLSSAMGVREGT